MSLKLSFSNDIKSDKLHLVIILLSGDVVRDCSDLREFTLFSNTNTFMRKDFLRSSDMSDPSRVLISFGKLDT